MWKRLLDDNQDQQRPKVSLGKDGKPSLELAVRNHPDGGKFEAFLARELFSCLDESEDQKLQDEVNEWGNQAPDNKEWMTKSYDLRQGTHESTTKKVELQDCAGGLQQAGYDRFREIVNPLPWVGGSLWVIICAGGYLAGRTADCVEGQAIWTWGFVGVGIAIQLYSTNKLTVLAANSTIEGRPLVKMIGKPPGIDGMRAQVILGIFDMVGRYTRALFVGYAIACDHGINDAFIETFTNSQHLYFLAPILQAIGGLGGLSLICFLGGPVLCQTLYMIHCRRKVRAAMVKIEEEYLGMPEEALHLESCIDDLAGYISWAMMECVGKVFDRAACPLTLEDDEDYFRMWDRTKTKTLWLAVKLIPDSVVQILLQSRFLALAFPFLDAMGLANILFTIVLTGADVFLTGMELVSYNRRLTVVCGLAMILFPLGAYIRIGAAFYCDSHVLDLSSFQCLPNDAIHRNAADFKNQAGILPC